MAREDEKHLARLRQLPCCRCAKSAPCEAHHPTGAGMAMRDHDHEAMPLCMQCHRDLHGLCGVFKGWKREQLKTWQREMSDKYRPAMEGEEVF